MARRLGVAREDVVDAAVQVLDAEGLDGLTVAAVAHQVGCRPPSVYHHVDGLDGLRRAVTLVAADDVARVLAEASADANGIDALRAMAAATHAWAVAHPGRFGVLCRDVDPTDTELVAARSNILLPVQDALAEAGVPTQQRPTLLAAIMAANRGTIEFTIDSGATTPLDDAAVAGRELLLSLLLDHVRRVATPVDVAADQSSVAP